MSDPNHVHGHEVMEMMIASGESYTRDTLRAAIHEKFGQATRFFTCSAEQMTADELIDFLESRGKFQPTDGSEGFQTDPSKICNH